MDDETIESWFSTNDADFYYAQPTSAPMTSQQMPKIPHSIQPTLLMDTPTSSPTKIVHISESTVSSVDKKEEDKRQLHLQSEKRRRQKIQTSYKYLEGIVMPILGNTKLSRAELLRRTADLVKDMHKQLQK
jgi:hypothetical protein